MKTAISITFALLLFVTGAMAQTVPVTGFTVEPGPSSNSCILSYTFTNNSAQNVQHLYLDLPYKTACTVEQLPGSGQFTQMSKQGSQSGTRYSWVANNSTIVMAPGGQVTVKVKLTGINRAQYLQAIANQPNQDRRFSRFPVHTQGAATSRNTSPAQTNGSGVFQQTAPPGLETPGGVPVYGPPRKGVKLSAGLLGGPGSVASLIDLDLDVPGYGNHQYIMFASLDYLPGIDVGGKHIHGNLDALAWFSLDPYNGVFNDFQGVIDPVSESAWPYIVVPQDPALAGFQFNLSCVILNQQMNGIADTNEDPFSITL